MSYDGASAALVRALKYRGASKLADTMAAAIVAGAPPGWVEPPGELVPVPLHHARARRRGFNQAELIAQAVARRTGLQVSDCLERSRAGAAQVGRGRAERLGGPAGSIRLRLGRVAPERPVIVDDVITTGATVAACATALAAPASERPLAVAYARTPGR